MGRLPAILLPILASLLIFGAVLWVMTGAGREVRFFGARPAAEASRNFSPAEIADGKKHIVERRAAAVAKRRKSRGCGGA